MKILVIGSGGREHALVWHLARFGHRLFCAPGNAGIARLAECVETGATDVRALADFAARQQIDLTIAGPEATLVAGAGDEFGRRGLRLFGPDAAGARLEGDKAFAKRLMLEAGIPTAGFEVFSDPAAVRRWLEHRRLPVVVKASGLAAGKGVVVCATREQAEQTAGAMLSGSALGDAGRTIVIEECLVGEEASVIALCDGRVCRMLIPSQDHKRLLNDDQGPNTGGMGAYAPAPVVTPAVELMLVTAVFEPLLAALRRHGIDYCGVIYAGIMLTAGGPVVLEFNCRFGDPETQAIVPLLQTDLAELALACIEGRLSGQELRWAQGSGVCVVAASAGYPGEVRKGLELTGDVWGTDEAVVFHAGTRCEGERIVASGGRVLGVTGVGSTLALARDRAYRALERVRFEGMQFRTDIGARGLGGPAGES